MFATPAHLHRAGRLADFTVAYLRAEVLYAWQVPVPHVLPTKQIAG